ncbi:hypothetical protein ANCDUO_00426 [Ancylostoma duodenale]|uniref:Uncharacterized protein n=1 Tax=Ancylostoma duodenale TaxID=51022 RepID=A0A0C2HHX0_9BILA|nr:hypothetical protein ANCDUO_00426 [Ancylostoma duodenale]
MAVQSSREYVLIQIITNGDELSKWKVVKCSETAYAYVCKKAGSGNTGGGYGSGNSGGGHGSGNTGGGHGSGNTGGVDGSDPGSGTDQHQAHSQSGPTAKGSVSDILLPRESDVSTGSIQMSEHAWRIGIHTQQRGSRIPKR